MTDESYEDLLDCETWKETLVENVSGQVHASRRVLNVAASLNLQSLRFQIH